MSSEKQLRGFILTRFFIVLAIVSVVEFTLVMITNRFLIPALVSIFKLNILLNAVSSEKLFLIVFVMAATAIVNKIIPLFGFPPVGVDVFLHALLGENSLSDSEIRTVTSSINNLTQDTTAFVLLILAVFVIAIIFITPYVLGGIFFSISVAREIRLIEREQEKKKREEERRRYLMISNIVHDLKTPMTTVYGYAKALNDGIVPADKTGEYHEAIMAKTDRMNEVVAMLLDYVKLDSEGFTIKKERIDICELVRECCASSFTDIEAAGDEIDVKIPDHPIFIKADSKQLPRVINNLITNAIRHNPEGTKICVSVTSDSETSAEDVRIFVADSGPAIPRDLTEQIFAPFITGDESRASDGGTGLGLPLSRKICDMHGFNLKLAQNPEMLRYRLGEEYQKVFVISM